MFKTFKQIKNSPFILPERSYYFGKLKFGTPYMYPRFFNSTIISIRREKQKYNRNKNFNLLGYNISYGWPIWFHINEIGWKDKWNSPRYENSPSFMIFAFGLQLCIFLRSKEYNDTYWEMFLWWKEYNNEDIKKSEESWGWINTQTKESTWDKSFIK